MYLASMTFSSTYLWLFDSHVLTLCPPLRNVSRVQAVTESRPSREIDNVLQITINFTLEANNRTRVNTSYILGHGIEKAYCSPSKAIIVIHRQVTPICLYVHVEQCMTFICVLSKNKQLVLKNWEPIL